MTDISAPLAALLHIQAPNAYMGEVIRRNKTLSRSRIDRCRQDLKIFTLNGSTFINAAINRQGASRLCTRPTPTVQAYAVLFFYGTGIGPNHCPQQ